MTISFIKSNSKNIISYCYMTLYSASYSNILLILVAFIKVLNIRDKHIIWYSIVGDFFIDFGRTPQWNCPLPEEGKNVPSGAPSSQARPTSSSPSAPVDPWFIPPIPCYEPEDGVFYAQIGPTGGNRGYNAITGEPKYNEIMK